MERENIINFIKSMNLTTEEIEAIGFKTKDEQLIHEVSQFIHENDLEEEARDWIDKKYWDDLAIEEKRFKLVNCRMRKVVYKDILVAMPEDKDNEDAENFIRDWDNISLDDLDSEDDWELDDWETEEEGLTQKEVDEMDYNGNLA